MAQNFLIQADTQPWGLKYKTENGQFMEATTRSRSKREEVNRGQRGKVTVRKRGDARGEQVPREGGREGGAGPVARTVGGTRGRREWRRLASRPLPTTTKTSVLRG